MSKTDSEARRSFKYRLEAHLDLPTFSAKANLPSATPPPSLTLCLHCPSVRNGGLHRLSTSISDLSIYLTFGALRYSRCILGSCIVGS